MQSAIEGRRQVEALYSKVYQTLAYLTHNETILSCALEILPFVDKTKYDELEAQKRCEVLRHVFNGPISRPTLTFANQMLKYARVMELEAFFVCAFNFYCHRDLILDEPDINFAGSHKSWFWERNMHNTPFLQAPSCTLTVDWMEELAQSAASSA